MNNCVNIIVYNTCALVLCVVAVYCQFQPPVQSLDPLIMDSSVVKANTAFSWDMFLKLAAGSEDGNVFYSPYSIFTALAMTLVGARGQTATQMRATLKFDDVTDVDLHRNYEALHSIINSPGAPYDLSTANRIFARKDYKFLEAFLKATNQHYKADAVTLDFRGDPESSRKHINDWVEGQTANKIKDLLPEGSIDPMVAMVLVNAIYFKGSWAQKFNPSWTKKEPFHMSGSESVDVDMMHMTHDLKFTTREDLDCQVLQLPYVKGDLAMYILLPNKVDGITALESKLNASLLQDVATNMYEVKVVLSMPRFKVKQSFDLGATLTSMGMSDLFMEGVADLSGMDGTRKLFVSKMVHKAFVEVNEEGTEAAAATGGTITFMSLSIPMTEDFKVDHPFLFTIRDQRTGSILFLGRVSKPV